MTIKQAIFSRLPDFAVRKYLKHKARRRMKRYEGSGVECPACGSAFRAFIPAGAPLRENVKCPRCESYERGRLMWLYLAENSPLFDGHSELKLLHFAPERFFYEKFSRQPNLQYVPCDLSPERYIFGGKIKVAKADVTRLPFDDSAFDIVICSHVLEHVPDDALAMSELLRVMKPGGWGVFQVPLDQSIEETYEDDSIVAPEERVKAFGQADHVRRYGKDYAKRLEKAGFKVTVDDFVAKFSESDIFRYGLDKSELIYRCEKAL